MPFIPVLTPQGSCFPLAIFPLSWIPTISMCLFAELYKHKIVSELIYSYHYKHQTYQVEAKICLQLFLSLD